MRRITNFIRILGICKDFAGNHINSLGNVPHRGVVSEFSELEVVALSITAVGFGSENLRFHRLHNEYYNEEIIRMDNQSPSVVPGSCRMTSYYNNRIYRCHRAHGFQCPSLHEPQASKYQNVNQDLFPRLSL